MISALWSKLRHYLSSRPQQGLPFTMGVVGSLVVIIIWQGLLAQQHHYLQELIDYQTHTTQTELISELQNRVLGLERLARRWERAEGEMNRQDWELDITPYINNFPEFQAIAWVDPEFQVRWLVSLSQSPAFYRFDLTDNFQQQQTLEIARDLRQTTISPILHLSTTQKSFWVCVPLFINHQFDGFLVGVFAPQTLFEKIIKIPPGYEIKIRDGEQLIYNQLSRELHPLNSSKLMEKKVSIDFYHRHWELTMIPHSIPLSELESPWLNLVLIIGLISV